MSATPRPRHPRWPRGGIVLAGAALVLSTACDEGTNSPIEPIDAVLEQRAVKGGWDLPLSGPGALARAFPTRPCMDAPHREFDFWVGDWNVVAVNDVSVQFGTNRVTSELDGCLVQEHWTSSAGSRGRSLNTFDAETGMWHQDWVSQSPSAFIGRLRTSGGLENGVMVLEGERDAVFSGTPFTFEDRWTWTQTPEGDVIQTGFGFAGPPFNQVISNFAARYVRGKIEPAPEQVTTSCDPGQVAGVTREADFLLGDWRVAARPGPELGRSTIETDLSGCLFVERFSSRGGLEAIAFTYWDAWNLDWYRIWVDSEGERLVLRGGLQDGSLVLRGMEATRSGEVEVRLTWSPDDSEVIQSWEVSRDGGATWRTTATLVYTP